MTVTAAIRELYGDDESAAIADVLVGHLTGLGRMELATRRHEDMNDAASALLQPAIRRLSNHEPVQYITGEAWFSGMPFYVDKNVLIPRPETDELVAWIVENEKPASGKVLDIGTGSGCIAISLKKQMPGREVWGCDKSIEALEVARLNADRLSAAVDFQQADILDTAAWEQLPVFDLIVSNPPYIPVSEESSIARHVKEYEPGIALFVNDDEPLIFYERIIEFADSHLSQRGKIYFEIHELRMGSIRDLAAARQWQVTSKKDMQGKDRMLCLQRKPVT